MSKKELIENYVRKAHEKGVFTGTWLYAENGEIISKGAVGYRDPEDRLPMQEDSVFDLASVTKQFTAAAVMLLRRRGLLDLEDEITKFFPEIPFKGVTIRNLLTHTGGLPDYMDWVKQTAKEENRIPGNDIIVRFLCESGEEAEFAPGEGWEYSNTGYCLLAAIVEKVSGIKFEEFLEQNIFGPAGMASTHVYHRRKDGLTIDNLACGLVVEYGGDRFMLPDDSEHNDYVVPLDGVNGDGLVHSNIFDLFKWDRVLREGKLLTPDEQKLMYTPAKLANGEIAGDPDDEDGSEYGFGWFVENDPELGLIVCHSGGWPGYSTWYQRYIDSDRVLIVLRSRDTLDDRAYEAFYAGIKAIARGAEPEPINTVEDIMLKDPDKSGWESFCGKYEFDEDGIFRIDEVFMKDSELYAKLFLRGISYEERLYPLEEKVFTFKTSTDEITFEDGALILWEETHRKL